MIRHFAADTPSAPPTPKSGGGGKKKKEKSHKFVHADSGRKFGHGADDRPPPALARQASRLQRAAADAASGKRHMDDAGNIVTDDESMQPVYDLINKGVISPAELNKLAAAYPAKLRNEELDAISSDFHHAGYAKLLKIPDAIKDKVRLVDDDVDYLAITGEAGGRGEPCPARCRVSHQLIAGEAGDGRRREIVVIFFLLIDEEHRCGLGDFLDPTQHGFSRNKLCCCSGD